MAEAVKLAIIYYSATGNIHTMAKRAAEAGDKAGAEVRLRHVAETAPEAAVASNDAWVQHRTDVSNEPLATPDDIVWADAVLFATPTRYGVYSAQLKSFIDSLGGQWSQGLLADKAYAGMVSSATAHGGQETTLITLYNTIAHFGGIIVPPGYTDPSKFVDGNPYGASNVDGGGQSPVGDVELTAVDHLTTRLVRIAAKLAA